MPANTKKMKLDEKILKSISGGTLFYPCSGQDTNVPIKLFAPYIQQFWFADISYWIRPNSADSANPLLQNWKDFEFLDFKVWYTPPEKREVRDAEFQNNYPWIDPCIRTERYLHIHTKRLVTIHRRRGYGTAALRKHINLLSIFFYRGDGPEGGSGTLWLRGKKNKPALINDVLRKLINGGLIVTDGSNCRNRKGNPYRNFGMYRNKDLSNGDVKSVEAFTDGQGCKFTCVAYIGERKGPTLVWQVSHP